MSEENILSEEDALGYIGDYHTRGKHGVGHFSESPLSVETIRTSRQYTGCERELLPLDDLPLHLPAAYSRNTLSILLLTSMALSGVKTNGDAPYFLRCNPSSGNLHPTETYIATKKYLYHYSPMDHALEKRASYNTNDTRLWRALDPGKYCGDTRLNRTSTEHTFAIIFSKVCMREEAKYGIRAYRYCELDLGHALAAVNRAANELGWSTKLLDHLSDQSIARILGLDRHDSGLVQDNIISEVPGAILLVEPNPNIITSNESFALCTQCDHAALKDTLDSLLIDYHATDATQWHGFGIPLTGNANPLFGEASTLKKSWDHPILHHIHQATQKPETKRCAVPYPSHTRQEPTTKNLNLVHFAKIARNRRTALGFDTYAEYMESSCFFELLQTALNLNLMTATTGGDVHLVIFVHRVVDIQPGLYLLLRSKPHLLEATLATLQGHIGSGNATWEPPPDITPLSLRDRFFTLLAPVDLRQLAADLACNQSSAADGHFSIAFLGDLASSVFFPPRPWRYPRLFWEAGALAHSFYLSAYTHIAATGLGCFFDDLFHQVMGLTDHRYQALYFLAVGPPLKNDRLMHKVDPYLLTRGQEPRFLFSAAEYATPLSSEDDHLLNGQIAEDAENDVLTLHCLHTETSPRAHTTSGLKTSGQQHNETSPSSAKRYDKYLHEQEDDHMSTAADEEDEIIVILSTTAASSS